MSGWQRPAARWQSSKRHRSQKQSSMRRERIPRVWFWRTSLRSWNRARWSVESGAWEVRQERLVQTDGASLQRRLVSRGAHPRDFQASVTLCVQGGELYRSDGDWNLTSTERRCMRFTCPPMRVVPRSK